MIYRRTGDRDAYADDIKTVELEQRIDKALTKLGIPLLVDNLELRTYIREQFAGSHVLWSKRQVGVAVGLIILAVFGLNWTSVRVAINSSAVIAATREAESARDRVVVDAATVNEVLAGVVDSAGGVNHRLGDLENRADALGAAIAGIAKHYHLAMQTLAKLFELPGLQKLVSNDAVLALKLQASTAGSLWANIDTDLSRTRNASEAVDTQLGQAQQGE